MSNNELNNTKMKTDILVDLVNGFLTSFRYVVFIITYLFRISLTLLNICVMFITNKSLDLSALNV